MSDIRSMMSMYPYFQTMRVLYTKCLRVQNAINYEQELHITAAHTTNRSVLFDYMFSDNDTVNLAPLPLSTTTDSHSDNDVEKENVLEDKIKESTTEEILSEDNKQSYEIDNAEVLSFKEWLKKANSNPMYNNTKDSDKKARFELIDKFIAEKPKIIPNKSSIKKENVAKKQMISPETLMTETLARIYAEQKNYNEAIQAYRILSLKYPEKSGFFADRIESLKRLRDQNN